MEQRISLITLGTKDMDLLGRFYEALGWSRVETEDGVIAFDLIGQTLGLYPLESLAKDLGLPVDALGRGHRPLAITCVTRRRWRTCLGWLKRQAGASWCLRRTCFGAGITGILPIPKGISGKWRIIRSHGLDLVMKRAPNKQRLADAARGSFGR